MGAGLSLPIFASLGSKANASRQDDSPAETNGRTLLVLGGTRFLGPAIVKAAKARGYEITLFNRGKSAPEMWPELETLIGDRNTHDLAALEGRKWDLVVDTSCYLPSHAKKAAEVLGPNVGHYVLISTISVYENGGDGPVVDESAPVGRVTDEQVARVTGIQDVMLDGGIYYGPLKALCEEQLEELMPGRVTSLRPGVIAGKDDPSDRLPYWVVRANQGGEILCPGDPDQDFQYTDVNDLAEWSVDFGERGVGGIFNAIGFEAKVTLQEFLHGCKIVLGRNDATYTWASEEFLLENEVRPFSEMPFWLPVDWAHHYSTDALIAAGATFRPIASTIRETIDWHMEERGEAHQWGYYGMQPAREAELLAAWHALQDGAEPAEPPETEPGVEGDLPEREMREMREADSNLEEGSDRRGG